MAIQLNDRSVCRRCNLKEKGQTATGSTTPMRSKRPSTDHVKVSFPLAKDQDGYPPYAVETLWARLLGANFYELDSIPFFARDVALGDSVEAARVHNELTFRRLARPGGHSTLRIIAFDPRDVTLIRKRIRELGADSELSDIAGLVAIDVPPSADLDAVRQFAKSEPGRWDAEESCLAGGPA
jgi:hypothetical protein